MGTDHNTVCCEFGKAMEKEFSLSLSLSPRVIFKVKVTSNGTYNRFIKTTMLRDSFNQTEKKMWYILFTINSSPTIL